MRFDLTEEEWRIIEPLLPPTRQGGERRDDRQVLDGIFYVLRTGIPWDDLPARYGPHTTAYNRFNRWARQGIWQRLFDGLARRHPASLEMIDSTAVLESVTHMWCCSWAMCFSAAPSSENDHGSMNLASNTAPVPSTMPSNVAAIQRLTG